MADSRPTAMRVVSLVPSWTETLIQSGVEVVGRTRFCIHPRQSVGKITVVGGTKGVDFAKIRDLKPDVVVMDREENTREMAERMEAPIFATHVTSLEDCARDLHMLGSLLQNPKLFEFAERFKKIAIMKRSTVTPATPEDWLKLPGVESWWRVPDNDIAQFVYMIWKNPWMAVCGDKTFIGSVWRNLGWGHLQMKFDCAYAKLDLDQLDPASTLLLFSSEPFAFHREKESLLRDLKYPCALVNGESFSWFGIRALRFLESFMEIGPEI